MITHERALRRIAVHVCINLLHGRPRQTGPARVLPAVIAKEPSLAIGGRKGIRVGIARPPYDMSEWLHGVAET